MRTRWMTCLISCLLLLASCGAEQTPTAPPTPTPTPGPLAVALKTKAAAFGETAPEELKQLFARASKELADSGILARAMNVDGRMPAIAFQDAQGERVSLASLLEQGPVVLAFYRGKW